MLAAKQLHAIRRQAGSPFSKKPASGYLRGIDFYSGSELVSTVARATNQFQRFHQVYPDLVSPKGFCEKVHWAKFFRELKVPESGNKLLTETFIPPEHRDALRVPGIAWHSPEPRLPSNDDIAPGEYYLKANHGSGLFRRLAYPLTDEARHSLERLCSQWLQVKAGVRYGEWHYSAFARELFLQESISQKTSTLSWDFYVFRGQVGHITVHKKSSSAGEDRLTWLTPDFQMLHCQNPYVERVPPAELKVADTTMALMRSYASAIGRDYNFLRVDFLVGDDETIYLGEITFTPADALIPFSRDWNFRLGQLWRL